MHVGSISLFESAPLETEAGGLDMERILDFADRALRKQPRFQQKLAYVPAIGHPVWVDDESFNLVYHIRHTRLPIPGDIRQLKRLAGRIMSQQLDRGKPLWEMWFVEGVEGGRFAVICKLHHCLVDGVSGLDFISTLMGPDPDYEPKPQKRWIPRPPPASRQLLTDELIRRTSIPLKLLRTGGRMISDASGSGTSLRSALEGIAEAASSTLNPADETMLNQKHGPHRRFDWARIDLDAAKDVKNRLGGKLNDVVLATVTGALRHFFLQRGARVSDADFRVIVPVNTRSDPEDHTPGNHVSSLIVRLPLEEGDALERYRRVVETTQELKGTNQSLGPEFLARLADATFSGLMTRVAQLGLWSRAANMIVTNVAGAQTPVYLLGARQLEVYPVVPLGIGQGLGIAIVSYAGGLFWGFNSDWDALPDLHVLVEATQVEFEALYKAAADSSGSIPLPSDP